MTTTSFHNILFSIAIIFSAETVSAKKVDVPFFRKSEKIVLTYDEFRRMRPVKQEKWIKAIQDFYVNLEKIEKGERVGYVAIEFQPVDSFAWLKVKALVPKICTAAGLFFKSEKAFAQRGSTSIGSANYSQFGSVSNEDVVESLAAKNTADKEIVERLKAQLQEAEKNSFNDGWQGRNEREKLKQQIRDAETKERQSAQAVVTFKADYMKTQATAKAQSASVVVPGEMSIQERKEKARAEQLAAAQEKEAAARIKTVEAPMDEAYRRRLDSQQRQASGSSASTPDRVTTQPVSTTLPMNGTLPTSDSVMDLTTGGATDPNAPRNMFAELDGAKPGESETNRVKKIESTEKTNKGKNSCIYAGWVQQMPDDVDKKERTTRCPRISKMTVGKPPVTFSCDGSTAKPTGTSAELPAPAGSTLRLPAAKNTNPKATILCNPVVFGLVDEKKNEPLCVEPSAKVTAECAKKSKEQKLDVSNSITRFRQEYDIVSARVNVLCTGDDADYKAHFKALGVNEAQIDGSVRDLSQTCITLRERLSEVTDGMASGSGSSSQSGGSN